MSSFPRHFVKGQAVAGVKIEGVTDYSVTGPVEEGRFTYHFKTWATVEGHMKKVEVTAFGEKGHVHGQFQI